MSICLLAMSRVSPISSFMRFMVDMNRLDLASNVWGGKGNSLSSVGGSEIDFAKPESRL